MTTSHARIIKEAAGRSWCGSPGKRVTVENRALCGSLVLTDRDVLVNGKGRIAKSNESRLRCPLCRVALGLPVKGPQ
jgi:hypothetical protein